MYKDLSVLEGEVIQNNQLKDWKQLLKEEVYIALAIRTRRDNHLATSGFDLFRGTDMSNFIGNYLYYSSKEGRMEQELGLRGYEQFKSLMTAK